MHVKPKPANSQGRNHTRGEKAPTANSFADWRSQGLCRDQDPELFFPSGVSLEALAQTREACAVCATCPVIGQCLEWALTAPERHGVWGGLSERDRRAILRSRAAVARHAAHPTLPRQPGRVA